MKVIQLMEHANGSPCPHGGRYLVDFDFSARDGWGGNAVTTEDPRKAKKFASAEDALLYWQTQSVTRPLRPDGRPNRPLTAITVKIRDTPP